MSADQKVGEQRLLEAAAAALGQECLARKKSGAEG
jgi:hypothetical protein